MYDMARKRISVVVPVYNEVDGIVDFLDKELVPEMERIGDYDMELIVVNDGSNDGTTEILKEYIKPKKKKLVLITFSRNFGKEAALSAGLLYSMGDAAITIDSDGQQPPKIMKKFIEKWEKGDKVVIGVREKFTKHGFIAKMGSSLFYKIMHMMGNKNMVSGTTDYRLLDRSVIEAYNDFTEHNRITRGLIDWMGFKRSYIEYEYGKRIAGKPSYDFKKLFRLAIDSFVSLSTTPLIIFGYIGIIITSLSFILGVFVIVQQYILGDPLGLYWNGAVQMAIFITFLVGLVLVSQAITALYISHIHAETQNRPLFIVDKENSLNVKSKNES